MTRVDDPRVWPFPKVRYCRETRRHAPHVWRRWRFSVKIFHCYGSAH